MSFLKKLFGSKPEEKPAVEKTPERSPTACPYCFVELEKRPTRKKKCPHCEEYIYVRKGILTTEEEANIIDILNRLEPYGVDQKLFAKHHQELSKQFGFKAPANDTVWRILNTLVAEKKDYFDKKNIYLEMAHLVQMEGKNPKQHLANAAKMDLLDNRENGYEQVQINNCNDDLVCKSCRSLEGKTFTIEEAMSEMPIPNLCQSDDGCRCWYAPVIDMSI